MKVTTCATATTGITPVTVVVAVMLALGTRVISVARTSVPVVVNTVVVDISAATVRAPRVRSDTLIRESSTSAISVGVLRIFVGPKSLSIVAILSAQSVSSVVAIGIVTNVTTQEPIVINSDTAGRAATVSVREALTSDTVDTFAVVCSATNVPGAANAILSQIGPN